MNEQEPPESLAVSHDAWMLYSSVARDRLDFQINQVDRVDEKLTTVITTATVILPITAGLLVQNPQESGAIPDSVGFLLWAAAASYAALFVVFYLGFQVKGWEDHPDFDEWNCVMNRFSVDQTYKWYGDGCSKSWAVNEKKLQAKASYLEHSIWYLAAEVGSLTLAVLFLLFN